MAGSKQEEDELLQLALDREVSGDDKKQKADGKAAPKAESKHKPADGKDAKDGKSSQKQDAPSKTDTEYKSESKGVYQQIPRVKATDMKMHDYIAAGKPVVITESPLGEPLRIWTPDYLLSTADEDAKWTVYESQNEQFRYWDSKALARSSEKGATELFNHAGYKFAPPTKHLDLNFAEFYSLLRAEPSGPEDAKAADSKASSGSASASAGASAATSDSSAAASTPTEAGKSAEASVASGDGKSASAGAAGAASSATSTSEQSAKKPRRRATYHYLQTKLTDAVGPLLGRDFASLDWGAVLAFKQAHRWGALTTNMLLVGQQGVVTPAHYDEQENIFAQLNGRKRVVLFGPDQYPCMYPFPLHHPCDRQSQVDVESPDLKAFPNFTKAVGVETVLAPGELLYIPSYWWHYITSLDETVSVNFWFKAAPTGDITFPLSATQRIALSRNIERFVSGVAGPAGMDEAFVAIANPDGPGLYETLKMQVLSLLLHVMPFEEVDPFLVTIAQGRYGVLPKEKGVLSGAHATLTSSATGFAAALTAASQKPIEDMYRLAAAEGKDTGAKPRSGSAGSAGSAAGSAGDAKSSAGAGAAAASASSASAGSAGAAGSSAAGSSAGASGSATAAGGTPAAPSAGGAGAAAAKDGGKSNLD